MEISTVKQQENGYLVNNSMSVPLAEGNRHYQMVQEWIAEGNTPEPMDIPDPQIAINQELLAYLASTDWYVTRFAEVGTPIPQEVLDARTQARASIV